MSNFWIFIDDTTPQASVGRDFWGSLYNGDTHMSVQQIFKEIGIGWLLAQFPRFNDARQLFAPESQKPLK